MFHEIKRPFKVFKEQIVKRFNVFSLSKKMIDDANDSIKTEAERPPVAKGVTKGEFRNRYKGLMVHSFVALFAFSYTLLFLFSSKNLLAVLISLLIGSFFFVNYFLSLYRAWIARFYFRNWEGRFSPRRFTLMQFMDAIFERPSLLLPVAKISRDI